MFIFTVILTTLLCLAFEPTRLLGIAGLALLIYLFPVMFTALLVVAGAAFIFSHHQP